MPETKQQSLPPEANVLAPYSYSVRWFLGMCDRLLSQLSWLFMLLLQKHKRTCEV